MLVTYSMNSQRTYFNTVFTHLACGDGTTAVTEADTALVSERTRLAKNSSDTSIDKKVEMEFIMNTATGNGYTYTEVGLFTLVSGGSMGSRDIIAGIEKNSGFEISFLVTFQVSNG
jgi:hypothetical protein